MRDTSETDLGLMTNKKRHRRFKWKKRNEGNLRGKRYHTKGLEREEDERCLHRQYLSDKRISMPRTTTDREETGEDTEEKKKTMKTTIDVRIESIQDWDFLPSVLFLSRSQVDHKGRKYNLPEAFLFPSFLLLSLSLSLFHDNEHI